MQLRQLEAQLGHALFERRNRRMTLTEAGRIALEHAETIFRAGDELLAALQGGRARREMLRIGAAATLSRNFQMDLIRPLLADSDLELVIRSGGLGELLPQLEAHTLDLVLSNTPVGRDAGSVLHSHLLAELPASLVSRPARSQRMLVFPEGLRDLPVVLPGHGSGMRAAFDLAMDQAGIRPRVLAEVDDMAMLRLMARESPGLTLLPSVVVQDELRGGVLRERCRIPRIRERFYAITATRRFPNARVRRLLQRAR